ncbi:MAG: Protein translocase subunit SecA, preprotein translocase subunit SecA, partial [Candidatus Paceibacter sp.]|nr:Protein translocase subunit SecA, preprotein translocase subunit SecA [Candidatus Paceibacter sp.]
EARRIDNQLRGRSGRQGDPGETQFFVSLEDSLMRIFASDSIKGLLGRFGIPEDEAIQNGMITRSLETAQTKIEGFNFDARKHTLEYDDVLNYQRKIIYGHRRKILVSTGEELKQALEEYLELDKVDDDTKKIIEEKKAQVGEETFYAQLRRLVLQNFDMYWIDHLEVMDYVRQSVNLRAYGQRDPLVEYKKEGLRLFKEMEAGMHAQVLSTIPSIGVNVNDEEERRLREVQRQAQLLGGSDTTGSGNSIVVLTGHADDKKGRNEKVTIVKNGTEMEIKYKKLEQFLKDGWQEKK